MSKNSKNAQRLEKARQLSKARQSGNKGASSTVPQHKKRWGYRTNPEVQKRIAEANKAAQESKSKTSGKKLLEGAGAASKEE